MTQKQIIICAFISTILILLPYVLNFAGNNFSGNTSDWENFSGYINGLIMPILTVANLFIIAEVNNTIKGKNNKFEILYKKLKQQMENGKYSEFRVDVEKQETIEESLTALDEKVKNVYDVLDTLAAEVDDKDFETTCLATPNSKARLNVQIAQLKVNIYKELFEASKSAEHEKKLEKAMKELQKLHKNTYLAD